MWPPPRGGRPTSAGRLYDALGAEPDEAYRQLEPSLVEALDVGGRWT